MIILGIDTSNENLSVALSNKEVILASKSIQSLNQHSVYAMSVVEEVLKQASLSIRDVNRIVVTNGPGSYTGVRIGLTIAKTLAYLLNIEVCTISSLKAQAISANLNTTKVVITDAKGSQIYFAVYNQFNDLVVVDQCIKRSELASYLQSIGSDYKIVISDEYSFNDELFKLGDVVIQPIEIKEVCKIAMDLDTDANIHGLTPQYLKITQAEKDLLKND